MVSSSSNTIRIATTKLKTNFTAAKEQKQEEQNDIFFDRKIENATVGLKSDCYKQFYKISYDNALTIANYILSMKSEINPADNYRRDNITLLTRFSIFHHNKAFKQVIREDILSFLDSLRKTEAADPLHKWVGTYNLFMIYLLRFFKWLYYPDLEPDKRSKPAIMENILQLKRKEKSIYKPRALFDVVAGTSSGAMNAAILVSNAVENGWNYAANKLNEFWDHVSTTPYIQNIPGFGMWWKNLHSADSNAASEEAARRYYSTKQFQFTGVQNVFSPLLPKPDTKFFDPQNIWPIYSNQPLKDSLERYAKFPIATSSHLNQPRLLLVSVDVLEGAVVTFDSYPKVGGKRKSEYGDYIKLKENGNKGGDDKWHYQFEIPYEDGIVSDYAIASGSVPINYDYSKLMANKLTVDSQGNKSIENVERYFWDGGIASNTPLRELIQAHKDYWLDVKGMAKIPDLDVYIADVWPTKQNNIAVDHDGVVDRNFELLLSDKTAYDEKVTDIVSDYINLVEKFIDLAQRHKIQKSEVDDILSKTTKKSKHRFRS
jgi:NTE family protein